MRKGLAGYTIWADIFSPIFLLSWFEAQLSAWYKHDLRDEGMDHWQELTLRCPSGCWHQVGAHQGAHQGAFFNFHHIPHISLVRYSSHLGNWGPWKAHRRADDMLGLICDVWNVDVEWPLRAISLHVTLVAYFRRAHKRSGCVLLDCNG